MNKSILISIRPEWVEKILNGEKTIEIRKTMPKCDLPVDVYIYCCISNVPFSILPKGKNWGEGYLASGKVVAKFTLNKIERFDVPYPAYFNDVREQLQHIVDGSCIKLMPLHFYLENKSGYAWHIDNLEIFDKPLELHNFTTYCDGEQSLRKAPQSWCYCYKEK